MGLPGVVGMPFWSFPLICPAVPPIREGIESRVLGIVVIELAFLFSQGVGHPSTSIKQELCSLRKGQATHPPFQ